MASNDTNVSRRAFVHTLSLDYNQDGQCLTYSSLGTEIMDSGRESYQYTPSRRHVSRHVTLDDGNTHYTHLHIGKHLCADPHSAFDQALLRKLDRQAPDESVSVIRGVDLFCGCGGLSLGMREGCLAIGRRFESVLAVDNVPSILEVYKANFSPKQAYESNIWTILDGQLGARLTSKEKAHLKGLDQIDILLAGPPCQGHSDLNNHTRRNDKRNRLYERVGRFAEIVQPKHVLVENVPTIVHSRDRALGDTIDLLTKCGYRVDTGVVDLSELGVPQRRKRHVLVASRNGSISIEGVIDKYRVSRVRDVEWAIGDLEAERANGIFTRPSRHNETSLRRIDYLFENGLYDLPNELRPPCHQDGRHSYKSMYGRMRYNEPAQTVTSGYGSPGQGRFIHPTQRRTLTPHEAARLQFLPDFFDFSSARRRTILADMIGNAVPMKLAYVFCLEFFA
jgi:DNA (cytosine-5)-methyltransferase 1